MEDESNFSEINEMKSEINKCIVGFSLYVVDVSIHTSNTGTTSMWEFNNIEGRVGSVPVHVKTTIGFFGTISCTVTAKFRETACFLRKATHASKTKS